MAVRSNYKSIAMCLILMTGPIMANVANASGLTFSSGKNQVRLIELFTSQGCSSCPPADRWVNQFTDDPRLWRAIIPIAFHVDYWDYLGWNDIYAARGYSERQRRYRTQGGVRSVYTPGFLVDGSEWRGWFARNPLPDHISGARELKATLDEKGLTASYPQAREKLVLNVAVLGFGIETPIGAGENEGSSLKHDFVVLAHDRHISTGGMWSVQLPYTRIRGAKRFALAMWVNTPDRQTPLQATGGWLPEDMIRRL